LKIIKDLPVGQESEAFSLSKDVHAIWGLDYVCFLPPSYAVKWVKVLNAINAYVSHAWNTDFSKIMSLDGFERKPILTLIEGVRDVADHYSS
jgi:hypothetical protein